MSEVKTNIFILLLACPLEPNTYKAHSLALHAYIANVETNDGAFKKFMKEQNLPCSTISNYGPSAFCLNFTCVFYELEVRTVYHTYTERWPTLAMSSLWKICIVQIRVDLVSIIVELNNWS